MVHWRRDWQTTSAVLPWEPPEQYEEYEKATAYTYIQIIFLPCISKLLLLFHPLGACLLVYAHTDFTRDCMQSKRYMDISKFATKYPFPFF